MLDDALLLSALRGEREVAAVCAAAGITPAEFARAHALTEVAARPAIVEP
jgi:hypothetical protein